MDHRATHAKRQPRLTVATALPKGDRQSVMLNMLAQLGVAAIIPLETERSVTKSASTFAKRAQRILIEACKQSRSPHVPTLYDSCSIQDALHQHDGPAILAHPGYASLHDVQAGIEAEDIMILIGPEGGFSDDEVASMGDQVTCASLGDTILRVETAAVAATSVMMMTRRAHSNQSQDH